MQLSVGGWRVSAPFHDVNCDIDDVVCNASMRSGLFLPHGFGCLCQATAAKSAAESRRRIGVGDRFSRRFVQFSPTSQWRSVRLSVVRVPRMQIETTCCTAQRRAWVSIGDPVLSWRHKPSDMSLLRWLASLLPVDVRSCISTNR